MDLLFWTRAVFIGKRLNQRRHEAAHLERRRGGRFPDHAGLDLPADPPANAGHAAGKSLYCRARLRCAHRLTSRAFTGSRPFTRLPWKSTWDHRATARRTKIGSTHQTKVGSFSDFGPVEFSDLRRLRESRWRATLTAGYRRDVRLHLARIGGLQDRSS